MNNLRVGKIINTHGVHGELKIFPTTDEVKRFSYLKKTIIDDHEYEVENVKYFKEFVFLKLKGINDMNEATKYKGKDLMVTRENALKLKEGEYFISDLIGLSVITDEGEDLGTIDEILETKANKVYVVGKILIPDIKECILNIDLDKKQMTVHLLEGLKEL